MLVRGFGIRSCFTIGFICRFYSAFVFIACGRFGRNSLDLLVRGFGIWNRFTTGFICRFCSAFVFIVCGRFSRNFLVLLVRGFGIRSCFTIRFICRFLSAFIPIVRFYLRACCIVLCRDLGCRSSIFLFGGVPGIGSSFIRGIIYRFGRACPLFFPRLFDRRVLFLLFRRLAVVVSLLCNGLFFRLTVSLPTSVST